MDKLFDYKANMPSIAYADVLGVKDTSILNSNFFQCSPLFLKAFKEYVSSNSEEELVKRIQEIHYEVIVKSSNHNRYRNKLIDAGYFNTVWMKLLNVDSNKYKKELSLILPKDISGVRVGVQSGILHELIRYGITDASEIYYRRLSKSLANKYSTIYNRVEAFNFLIEAAASNYGFIDYDNHNQVSNLIRFYRNLNLDNPKLLASWLEDSEGDKISLLMYSETLNKNNFTKFLEADLPVKHWGEHLDMPRDWLVNLYKNA